MCKMRAVWILSSAVFLWLHPSIEPFCAAPFLYLRSPLPASCLMRNKWNKLVLEEISSLSLLPKLGPQHLQTSFVLLGHFPSSLLQLVYAVCCVLSVLWLWLVGVSFHQTFTCTPWKWSSPTCLAYSQHCLAKNALESTPLFMVLANGTEGVRGF